MITKARRCSSTQSRIITIHGFVLFFIRFILILSYPPRIGFAKFFFISALLTKIYMNLSCIPCFLRTHHISSCLICWGLCSSGMLRDLCWSLFADVLGSPLFLSVRVIQSDFRKTSLSNTLNIFPLLWEYACHAHTYKHLKLGSRLHR